MPPAVRVRSWLRCVAAAAALFFAGPARAALEIIGSHSYTYNVTAGTVALNVATIQNTGASTVGPIRLELWFATAPYSGSPISGWRAGILPIAGSDGTLVAGKSFSSVSATVALGSRPPTGTSYAMFLVTRYSETCTSADKYCASSYLNISPAANIPASGSVSGSGNTLVDDYAASTSTTGTVTVGGARTGSIESAGDIDWFSVSLTAGATYQIDVRGSASSAGTLADPFLALRSSTGALLDDDDDSGTGLDAQLAYTPTTSGTYYVAASAYSSTTGTYTVAVTATSSGGGSTGGGSTGGGSTGGGGTGSTSGDLVFTEYATSSAGHGGVTDITAGPDGNLWFTEGGIDKIARITPAGVITEFSIPRASSVEKVVPNQITAGPDGNLWFTEQYDTFATPDHQRPMIGRITPQGSISEFTAFSADKWIGRGIAAGPDGNLWFTTDAGRVARITTSGVVTAYLVPRATLLNGIAAGPDGNLWFPEGYQYVSRISTGGAITPFTLTRETVAYGGIARGSDGNMWFPVELGIAKVTTAGAVTIYELASGDAREIAAGPDGNLWFTQGSRIGRITPAGVITMFTLPTLSSSVTTIAAGPDGNMWYGTGAGKVGKITLAASSLNVGAVFSTAQTASQSFLRFYNTGTSAGTVTATLRNYASGQSLGDWTSTSIPAGGELQFSTATIESEMGLTDKPAYYSVSVQPNISGYFQHVLFRPTDGTLTNLSTCALGVTADPLKLSGVHSSVLQSNFPSTVVVNNTGSTATTAALEVYDARNGNLLGTYTTSSIPAGGQIMVSSAMLETASGAPASGVFHYVVKAQAGFTGFLQHLVNNVQARVITDMTTACALNGVAASTAATPLRAGAVFSTAQTAAQSFLRFYNTGAAAGTVTATFYNYTTGQSVGQWTSTSIPAGGEIQFAIGTIESEMGLTTKPDYYSVSVQSGFTGYFQHVLFRPTDGTLTNLSTCGAGVTADPLKLSGVHSSALQSNFPSTVVVNNSGSSASTAALSVYDARNGNLLGTYTTASIPAGGHVLVTSPMLETASGAPGSGVFHYVVKAQTSFTGFLQHLVNNVQAAVTTDMTTACAF